MLRTLFYILFLFTTLSVAAQEDSLVLLDQRFVFENGVYVTYSAFRQNKPDIAWKDVEANWVTNPQTLMTQIEFLRRKDTGEQIAVETVWGVVIGGVPYIRLQPEEVEKPLPVFAGFRLWGNICYYSFETEVTQKIAIHAYNPNTGKPFRTGYIDREETVLQERMLRFETGEIAIFNQENFLDWIKDDQQLWNTVSKLSPTEAKEKLFKSLLIYDDRHAVYVKI